MIPASFEYKRPSSVAEAIAMLRTEPGAKILAGGHSLIPALKLRLNQPSSLIDISRLKELKSIRDNGKYIGIGSAVTHAAIAGSRVVQQKLPLLAHAAGLIGDVQVRNMGTIGGSIAHADPAADWPAVLIAANATIGILGPSGERQVAAGDFFKGFFTTALGEGEIITEILAPEPEAGSLRYAYEKFAQPASRFALAACAVQYRLDDGKCASVRVALNGVSDSAYRATAVEQALEGKPLNVETIKAAAQNAAANASMILSDAFAGEEYRRHLAQVVCRRALEKSMI